MTPNKELFRETVNTIIDFPKNWDQTRWHETIRNLKPPANSVEYSEESPSNGEHCGSTHCFAGWVQILTHPERKFRPLQHDLHNAGDEATEKLNITKEFANWLFDANRTFNELYQASKAVINGTIGADGLDKDGYYVDGFDEYGVNADNQDRYYGEDDDDDPEPSDPNEVIGYTHL
jgi:hypothetical protein